MFVRFRQTARRLQVSLVETRRDGDKVRFAHIAGLGTVPLAADAAERSEYWRKLSGGGSASGASARGRRTARCLVIGT
jgi:hypothetical protein